MSIIDEENTFDLESYMKDVPKVTKRAVIIYRGDSYEKKTVDKERTQQVRAIQKCGSLEEVKQYTENNLLSELKNIVSQEFKDLDLRKLAEIEQEMDDYENYDPYMDMEGIPHAKNSLGRKQEEDCGYLPKAGVSVFDIKDGQYMRKDNYPQDGAEGIGFGEVAKGKQAYTPVYDVPNNKVDLRQKQKKLSQRIRAGVYDDVIDRLIDRGYNENEIFNYLLNQEVI